jgi:hypothetical protein
MEQMRLLKEIAEDILERSNPQLRAKRRHIRPKYLYDFVEPKKRNPRKRNSHKRKN